MQGSPSGADGNVSLDAHQAYEGAIYHAERVRMMVSVRISLKSTRRRRGENSRRYYSAFYIHTAGYERRSVEEAEVQNRVPR
jgi:hypothetical protein